MDPLTEILKMVTPHAPTLILVIYFGYRIVQELSMIRERITRLEQQVEDHILAGN